MKNLAKSDKILSISHKDFDGVVSQIVLGNIFDNILYFNVNYASIDAVLETVNFNKYDYVILTDISPTNSIIFDKVDNLILIDHHDTALKFHNPYEHKYVNNKFCAAKLTKLFVEKYFNIKLNHLNDLIYLSNDYDLWIHKNIKSKLINQLYYRYWDEKFRKRFFNGDTRFTSDEIAYLRERIEYFNKLYNSLEINELEKIKACFIISFEWLNELCDALLNEGKYKLVFCLNPKSKKISVRHRIDGFHVGNFLKELNIGGGHKDAGAIDIKDMVQCQKCLEMLEKEIYERFLNMRK